jgi:F0F1-type ATP synthase assembly protein I
LRRGRTKGPLMLFLFLLAGVIVGSIVGNIIATYSDAKIFNESFTIGTQGMPAILDFNVIKLAFGLSLNVNFGTMLGVLLGIFLYYRY